MCTISVVPLRGGFRIACNRDERVTRPFAEPPQVRCVGSGTAAWPLDPLSGGTWIGANDVGLAIFILNRTPRRRPVAPPRPRSRGTIIPILLQSRWIESAVEAARDLPMAEFEPFTLVALQGTDVGVLTNAGGRMSLRTELLSKPMVFTSSSLGDHVVWEPRRALFTQMIAAGPTPLSAQAAFHEHRWPERPEISVRMTRPGAATVSRTILEVVNDAVHMKYTALVP